MNLFSDDEEEESDSKSSNLGAEQSARKLLDQLLDDSRLYKSSQSYLELLQFIQRLRNFAPFNAMLLHIQKPGLRYAATAKDWWERFQRRPKLDARPLLILWPFTPVVLVYDVQDTEGKELPADVKSYFARGAITSEQIKIFIGKMALKKIDCQYFDGGDSNAGSIRCVSRDNATQSGSYRMQLNRNHTPAVQFVTIAHELAHLYMGHQGEDKKLKIHQRFGLPHGQRELEAESIAYLVCARNGMESKSETYLTNYVHAHTTMADLDLHRVVHAAGQIETLLGLESKLGLGSSTRAPMELALPASQEINPSVKPTSDEEILDCALDLVIAAVRANVTKFADLVQDANNKIGADLTEKMLPYMRDAWNHIKQGTRNAMMDDAGNQESITVSIQTSSKLPLDDDKELYEASLNLVISAIDADIKCFSEMVSQARDVLGDTLESMLPFMRNSWNKYKEVSGDAGMDDAEVPPTG